MVEEEEGLIREFYQLDSGGRVHFTFLERQQELGLVSDQMEIAREVRALEKRCVDLLIRFRKFEEEREKEEKERMEKEGPMNLLMPSFLAMIHGSLVGYYSESIGLTMCASVIGALVGSLYIYKPHRSKFYLDEKIGKVLNLLKKLTQ